MREIAIAAPTFNYELLDETIRRQLLGCEERLDVVLKRSRKEIGEILLEVKALLPHGMFMQWCSSKNIKRSSADNYMLEAQGKLPKSGNLRELPEQTGNNGNGFNPNEHGMGQGETVEWLTPREIVDDVLAMFGAVSLDPCSNSDVPPNIPARKHYTREDDGLSYTWEGTVFLNPPYGREIGAWVEKLLADYQQGHISEAIALLPARMDTQWFIPLYNHPIGFIIGRICFSDGNTAAPFPSCLVYLGKRVADFVAVFGHWGPVMQRVT